tara:strand:- start:689 stop:1123 length:435 start_codon:yes stop_codon:yes gene_type:complete
MENSTFYFAYGLNLEEFRMTSKHPSARFYKFAVLKGFRLIFAGKDKETGKGLCSISPNKFGDYVEGVLYTVDTKELSDPIDKSKVSVMDILTDEGKYVRAKVYYVDSEEMNTPSLNYIERIHKKYQDYGFNMKNLENALELLTQ